MKYINNERKAGYEKIRFEYINKSKVPSFEVEKLEAEYGVITKGQELCAVEISYKKKYDNLTKKYFIDECIARDYFNKVADNMRNEVIGRAFISDKPSELKKLSKVKDLQTQIAVSSNPNTSADTLLSLWKGDFAVNEIVLNNPNADIKLLRSIIENSKNIASIMVARENLRKRNLLCQK